VRSRAEDPSRGAVGVYIVTRGRFKRFAQADGVSRSTDVPPRGRPDLRSGPFSVYVARSC
jgi:hypothetical protein